MVVAIVVLFIFFLSKKKISNVSTNSSLEAREGNAGILGRLPPLPPGSGAPASLPLPPRPGARFPSRKKVWLDAWPAPATGRFPPALSSVPRCPCLRRARPAASSASLAGSLPGWLPRGQMSRASSRGKASVPDSLPTRPHGPSPAGRRPPARQPCTVPRGFSRLGGVPP